MIDAHAHPAPIQAERVFRSPAFSYVGMEIYLAHAGRGQPSDWTFARDLIGVVARAATHCAFTEDRGHMTYNRRATRAVTAKLALLAGMLWFVAGACLAQTAPPAADTAPPDAERPLFERATLTGAWGGVRPSLAKRGVEIGIANWGDLMPVVSGGLERRTFYAGLFEPTLSVDLDRLLGWKGARIFVRGIGTYGNDPADGTESVQAPSNLANGVDTFKIFEAWIEQRCLDDTVALLAGLYAADTEFDVKETAGVFMNGGFGTGPDLSESGVNGPCVFPSSCVGVRVRYQPTPARYAQVAVLDGVAGNRGGSGCLDRKMAVVKWIELPLLRPVA